MMRQTTYTESQYMAKTWVVLIVIFVGLFLGGIFTHNYLENGFNAILFGILSFSFLMTCLVLTFILHTKIDKHGIHIQYFPLHFSYVIYRWKDISSLEHLVYRPLRDFGGWGVRYGRGGVKAFTVAGSDGLLITFKDGKKRLIGTQKIVELRDFLLENHEEKWHSR